jgi:4-hydroxy-tetrahydrodipicolinate synthase
MTFPGIIPAVITPFDAHDRVDVAALEANAAHLLELGVHGLIAAGTMGEAGSLTEDERRTVIETVVRTAAGAVPVLAGVSAGATRLAVANTRLAREAGVQGVMCLPPLNYAGTPDEHVAFFAAVAAEGLPVMAYNNPEASGIDLTPPVIAELADAVPGVVAIKECSGDARRIPALLNLTRLQVLVGGDDWALEGFAAGATGWVSGVANVAPEACVALLEQAQAGELAAARETYRRILPLARLDMTPKLVQYFKGAMDAVGLAGGPTRPPRGPLGAAERKVLDTAVAALREPVAA